MEVEPAYGTWNLRMSSSERKNIRKRIIKGGKIADEIREMAKSHHEAHEIPSAERKMESELKTSEGKSESVPNPVSLEKQDEKKSFLQRFLLFLKRLFLP